MQWTENDLLAVREAMGALLLYLKNINECDLESAELSTRNLQSLVDRLDTDAKDAIHFIEHALTGRAMFDLPWSPSVREDLQSLGNKVLAAIEKLPREPEPLEFTREDLKSFACLLGWVALAAVIGYGAHWICHWIVHSPTVFSSLQKSGFEFVTVFAVVIDNMGFTIASCITFVLLPFIIALPQLIYFASSSTKSK